MKIAMVAWMLLGIVWGALYWPLLVGQVPAFRDAYHFYYPLEVWLDRQAQQGDIFPSFNACDGLGTNLAGEMSTGLFYPGRILWWLPWLSVAQRFGVVMLAHTIIAGFAAAYAARRMQLGNPPQLLAATAYSLSGPVFFQHANPIYLISSAWLPFVLAEAWVLANSQIGERASKSHSSNTPKSANTAKSADDAPPDVRWMVWIIGCSLMLLGGDPQCTLHGGLITSVALLFAAWHSRSLKLTATKSVHFAVAVFAVAGLTAIQTLPTWYWYRTQATTATVTSAEAERDRVPALLSSLPTDNVDLARGSPYAYSVAPWHLITLLWSNGLGHFMPNHSRAISAWPAESRMWTASLSVGVITFLLALACLVDQRTRRVTGFLWLVALISGSAMLGNYTPMWMLRNGLSWCGISLVGYRDEVGGAYWLLSHLVPGYDAFRYPAKWSPVFALSLTLCAAMGLQHLVALQNGFRRALRWLAVITCILCLAVIVVGQLSMARNSFSSWLAHAPVDGWLGAIDPIASLQTIVISCVVSSFILCVGWLAIERAPKGWQPWCLVLLVIGELGWSAHLWLVTAPPPQLATQLPTSQDSVITRVWAASGRAAITQDIAITPVLAEKLDYQQRFALAKLHLLADQRANLAAYMTLTPRQLAVVRHQLSLNDPLKPTNAPLDEALRWLGVQWRLVRSEQLQWQAIENASPLVELEGATSENALRVKYLRPGQLGLQLVTDSDQRMVVRMLQDGGWRATLQGTRGPLILKPQPTHLGLFQSLDVPAGKWEIELHYTAPGIEVGTWISGITLLVLFFLSLRVGASLLSSSGEWVGKAMDCHRSTSRSTKKRKHLRRSFVEAERTGGYRLP